MGGLLAFGLTGSAGAAVLIIDTFETNDGHFASSPTASGTSTGSITAVPEPTFGFLSVGALALIRRRR